MGRSTHQSPISKDRFSCMLSPSALISVVAVNVLSSLFICSFVRANLRQRDPRMVEESLDTCALADANVRHGQS